MYFNNLRRYQLQFTTLAFLLLPMFASYGQKTIVQPKNELITINGTATINLLDEYQNIRGFGGMNMPDWIDDLNADQVDKAFGNNPGQIGLNIMRIKVPNTESIFNIQVRAAKRAIADGAIVMASPWSPPASMKSNNSIVGGYLKPESYGAFADYLLDFADFMEENGAPLYAISIQNEPDVTVSYESCDYTPTQMLNFIKEQGSKFGSINVIASESFHFDQSQTDPILNDADAVQYVDIIGGHIYGGGLADYPLARSKGKEVWMTEHYTESSHSGNDWPLALNVGTEIHNCMTANFNAYVWWYVRRFYGLIGDNGNITKRGYVMSQFSKFVRPGYKRVGVSTDAVSNVYISAYKTDSTLVVVAVNRNTGSTMVDFVIQNGTVDSLAAYTTSGSKDVENGGYYKVNGGAFSAELDGQSITTFATYTGNAGKTYNVAPVANAGPDQVLFDDDKNGLETVTLDGSGSSDSDGSITNYSWSLEDKQISWGESPSLDLPTGEHSIILTVTDNDGATHADTVAITINLASGSSEAHLWFEVECGEVGSNWIVSSDATASNGSYASSKPGFQSLNPASEDSKDHIVITFNITEAGNYTLWGRAKVPTADDDSFWLKMDDGSWIMWNNITGNATWQWDDVHDSNNGNTVVSYQLTQGSHTLIICYREDGAGLDKLYLTNTGNIPSGSGDNALNCMSDGVNESVNDTEQKIILLPNPAKESLTIELKGISGPENELYLYNSNGMLMNSIKLENKIKILDISGLPEGLYFIKMSTGNNDILVQKFMKM
jgi:O-glycosyl hydrolase